MLVNTWLANERYSLRNGEIFAEQIQMKLSPKTKTFYQPFIAFLKSTLKPEYFEKKKMGFIA